MFTYADGRPIRPEYLSHRFRQLTRQLGLPPTRLHDLRARRRRKTLVVCAACHDTIHARHSAATPAE